MRSYVLIGYVIAGFLHPDDASKEIQEATGLDKRITDPVTQTIIARIITPLRQEVDDIYNPADKTSIESKASINGGPVMIEEIKKTNSATQAQKFIPFYPTPKPQTGNQKQKTETPAPFIQNKETLPQIPKPVILQENTSFESNKKTSDFHIDISDDKMKGFSNIPRPTPIKPAMIELGEKNAGNNNLVNPQQKSAQIPKVVDNTKDAKYEGEFSSIQSLPKISKDIQKPSGPLENNQSVKFFSMNPIQTTEKNRTVTELTLPTAIPFPQKTSGDISKDQPSPIKPVIIQKDYPEIKTPQKPPMPPQVPSPNIPIPPRKN